ncbi:hypothetical protein ZIOFF_044093 [Zingiber officinale]|uniref:Uncharacterized protein n=1 Tax=Zingiber officinale TaxID=94328 RepID=A0A8J5FUK7_ZINOF|nr:hypothetical protein ZIOFF_044093 [Zingiber officinale]
MVVSAAIGGRVDVEALWTRRYLKVVSQLLECIIARIPSLKRKRCCSMQLRFVKCAFVLRVQRNMIPPSPQVGDFRTRLDSSVLDAWLVLLEKFRHCEAIFA